MTWRVNIDDDLYKDETHSPFITYDTDGITTIRMHASDGSLWDFTVDATGAWVSTAVAALTGGSAVGLLLALNNLE